MIRTVGASVIRDLLTDRGVLFHQLGSSSGPWHVRPDFMQNFLRDVEKTGRALAVGVIGQWRMAFGAGSNNPKTLQHS